MKNDPVSDAIVKSIVPIYSIVIFNIFFVINHITL